MRLLLVALSLIVLMGLARPQGLCEDALSLRPQSSPLSLSLPETPQRLLSCVGLQEYTGSGQWFALETTPGTFITLTTCGSCFDTVLTVFSSPSSNCSVDQCITQNDDIFGVSPCQGGACGDWSALWSSVSFCAEAGRSYYVQLSSVEESAGQYSLQVSEGPQACQIPPNSAANSALPVTLGTTVEFDSTFARGGLSTCFGVDESYSVWYTVEGTGHLLRATTCHSRTDFGTALAVFSEEDSQSMECEAASSLSSTQNVPGECQQSIFAHVSWCSQVNVTYLIMVSGIEEGGPGALTVEELDPCDYESQYGRCTRPYDIELHEDYYYYWLEGESTYDTQHYIPMPACHNADMPSEGIVWFTWTGTGSMMTIQSCGSEFDTILELFRGSCFELECIQYNDDSCSLQSSLSFCSEPGVVYYVALGGYGTGSGYYQLVALDRGPCQQEPACDAVQYLTNVPSTSYGDLSLLPTVPYQFSSCEEDNAMTFPQNAWYAVTGSDRLLSVDTCGSCVDVDLFVMEYQTSCDDMRCISQEDYRSQLSCTHVDRQCGSYSRLSGAEVSFCAASDSFYFIVVSGMQEGYGSFQLNVEEGEPCLPNDDYNLAKPLSLPSALIVNTTYGWTRGDGLCNDTPEGVASAWYSIQGTGKRVQVTIAEEIVAVQVLTSTDGKTPNICMEGQVLYDGTLHFCTKPDQVYWISVGGISPTAFILGVQEIGDCLDVENQACPLATRVRLPLTSSRLTISGSTEDAGGDFPPMMCNGEEFGTAHVVWYSIVGKGYIIQASTCRSEFDTKIMVLEADCDFQVCVTSNDDSCGLQSQVEFCGLRGMEYFVGVTGVDGTQAGDFELVLSERGSCHNDICRSSTFVDEIPTTIVRDAEVSMVDLSYYQVPTDCLGIDNSTDPLRSYWLHVHASERRLIKVTAIGIAEVPVSLSVYTVDCAVDTSQCAPFVYSGSTSDTQYVCGAFENFYLRVSPLVGMAEIHLVSLDYLSIPCGAARPGSNCLNANPIDTVPHMTFASSRGAQPFSLDTCGQQGIFTGHTWYAVQGSGSVITADASGNSKQNVWLMAYEKSCSLDRCLSVEEGIISFCAAPRTTYYVVVGSVGRYSVGNYEIFWYEEDSCAPSSVDIVSVGTRTSTSIQIEWAAPDTEEAITFELSLYNLNGTLLSQVNTTALTWSFEDLQPDTHYHMGILARSRFGESTSTLWELRTLSGNCDTSLLALSEWQWERDIIQFRGALFHPSSSAQIHGVYLEAKAISWESIELFLFENVEGRERYFVQREHASLTVETSTKYQRIAFEALEWTICKDRQYILVPTIDGDVPRSNSKMETSTCLGDFQGVSLDAWLLNSYRKAIWYDPEILSPLYDLSIDATLRSEDTALPGVPTIIETTAGAGSLSFRWTVPCSDIPLDGYVVSISPDLTPIEVRADVTEYTFTNLTSGIVYELRVAAKNSRGLVGESALRKAATDAAHYMLNWVMQPDPTASIGSNNILDTVIDAENNVYAVGIFYDLVTFGSVRMETEPGSLDGFLLKYNAAGTLQWALHLGRGADSIFAALNVALDADGQVYVSGYFEGSAQLAPDGETLYSTFSYTQSLYLAKYDAATGDLIWHKSMNDIYGFDLEAQSLVIDKAGDRILMVAYCPSYAEIRFVEDNVQYSDDLWFLDGTMTVLLMWDHQGELLHVSSLQGSYSGNEVIAGGSSFDEEGNIYISGEYHGDIVVQDVALPKAEGVLFVVKFDPTFTVQWVVGIGADQSNYAFTLKASSELGLVTVGGDVSGETIHYYTSDMEEADEAIPVRSFTNDDYSPFLATFSTTDGSLVWTSLLYDSMSGVVWDMQFSPRGELVLSGSYFTGATQSDEIPAALESTAFIMSLNATTSNILAVRTTGSPFDKQEAYAIAISDTAVAVGGYFEGSAIVDCNITMRTTQSDSFLVFIDFVAEEEESLVRGKPKHSMGTSALQMEVSQCNFQFHEQTGRIVFPENKLTVYPNNYECKWLIQVDDVPQIMGFLEHFEFADGADTLTIYDGATTAAPMLHYYDGTNAVASETLRGTYDEYVYRDDIMIRSTGPALLLHFQSGRCNQGPGFTFSWESTQTAAYCDVDFPQVLTLESGLVSERFRGGYRDGSDCLYVVQPPSSRYIVLEFTLFDLDPTDYVEIRDGDDGQGTLLGRFNGTQSLFSLPTIQTLSSSATVQFVSNGAKYDRGFVLAYRGIVEAEFCVPSTTITNTTSGTIRSQNVDENYLSTATCSWDLLTAEEIDPDERVYLYFDSSFNVPSPGSVIVTTTQEGELIPHEVDDSGVAYVSQSSIHVEFNATGSSGAGFVGHFCVGEPDEECGEIFTEATASFDNHYCGLYYASNSQCEWTFAPQLEEPIHYLMVHFPLVDFYNTEEDSPTDYVQVMTTHEGLPRQLGLLSHADNDPDQVVTFVTRSDSLIVRFQSDEQGSAEGFNATACASAGDKQSECNGPTDLSAPTGTFGNQFCGGVHAANASCHWEVKEKNTPIHMVMLIFHQLQFASETWSGAGWNDNVVVHAGNVELATYNYGGAHGADVPPRDQQQGRAIREPEILSIASSDVSVDFTSDDRGFAPGFQADYCLFTERDERLCRGTHILKERATRFHNRACGDYYQANANCLYLLHPSRQSAQEEDIILYILSADFVNTRSVTTDRIQVYNSGSPVEQFLVDSLTRARADYDATEFPKAYVGTRSEMAIKFDSDDVGFGRGFEAEFCTVAKPAEQCGGLTRLTASSGTIVDHSCGPTYYAPMNCKWEISPSGSYRYIAMIFHALDLGEDALVQVTTGEGEEEQVYRSDRYLDNVVQNTRILDGSALFVEERQATLQFTVENNAPLRTGWEVEYLTVDDTGICSGQKTYSSPQGYISDHVYGKFYSVDQECNFLVRIPGARAIAVRFEYFDLEQGFDFLEIYDGSSWQSELIAFHTGEDVPAPFVTTGNELYLTFRTDYSVVQRGFRLFYSDADLIECPLFCSGHGSCVNGKCQCQPDHYGEGCEIGAPPQVREAQFIDSLYAVAVTFDKLTNRAGMFGSGSTNCSQFLEASTIALLGSNPRCVWRDDQTLLVQMGYAADLLPGDKLSFQGGKLQEANPTSYHPLAGRFTSVVQAPSDPQAPEVIITGPGVVQYGSDLTLDASASYVTGARPLHFNWTVDQVCRNGLCNPPQEMLAAFVTHSHDAQLVIVHDYFVAYPVGSVFHFSCVATNFLGIASASEPHVVTLGARGQPMTTIKGGRRFTIRKEEPLLVRSQLFTTQEQFIDLVSDRACPRVQWHWELVCQSAWCVDEPVTLPSVVARNQSEIYLPANLLEHGTSYLLQLEISASGVDSAVPQKAVETVRINVEPFSLDIQTVGGIQIFSSEQPIRLDAQPVTEQSDLTSSIRWRWACRKLSGYLCKTPNDEYLQLDEGNQIVIPAQSLPAGDYVFRVVGSLGYNGTVLKDHASVSVRVLRSDQPFVRILRGDNLAKHPRRQPLILHADVGASVRQIQWSVSAGDLQLDASTLWSEDAIHTDLVIAPNTLQDGATYRFKATVQDGAGRTNAAEIEIRVNEAPVSGVLTVSPTFGFSMDTSFSFAVDGASDDKNDMPLRYVFGIIPAFCEETHANTTECALIPLTNELEFPRFQGLLPPGEYYGVVDIFDRYGSYSRVRSEESLRVYHTCPAVPHGFVLDMDHAASMAQVFQCLGDLDSVRQTVNLASVILTCADGAIPADALSIYLTQLHALLEATDRLVYDTEISVDNRVKSLFLSSSVPLQNQTSALLRNSEVIAQAVQSEGLLRSDSAVSLLTSLSNLIEDHIDPESSSSLFRALEGLSAGVLRSLTCGNIPQDVQSPHIALRSRLQTIGSLSDSPIFTSSAPGAASFLLPPNLGLTLSSDSCVSFTAVEYNLPPLGSTNGTLVSAPADLTLADSQSGEALSVANSAPIEIRIPIPENKTAVGEDERLFCSSWNEATQQWEENCEYVGEEEGFYVVRSTHLTSFAVLLGGIHRNGGGRDEPSISSFGSFASDFTAASAVFGSSNLNEEGQLVSSFTALSRIPDDAFDPTQSIYDILNADYDYSDSYRWQWDSVLTLAFSAGAIVFVLVAAAVLSLPPIRNRVNGVYYRTQAAQERSRIRRQQQMDNLRSAVTSRLSMRSSRNLSRA